MWPSKNNLRSKHLSESDLIAYLDGESAAPEQVRRHLEGCWECRVRCQQTEEAVREFMVQRSQSWEQSWQPPDRWTLLRARMNRAQNEATAKKTAVWAWPKVAGVAAMAALAVWVLVRQPATVSAAEILGRSESMEMASLPAGGDPVVHRTLTATREPGNRKATWELWRATRSARYQQRISGAAETVREIQAVLEKNRLDPQSPLSAAGYRPWAQTVRVQRGANGERLFLIAGRSAGRTGDDAILETSLTIRESDWRPVAHRFTVQNSSGQFEYSLVETAREVVPFERAASIFGTPAAGRPERLEKAVAAPSVRPAAVPELWPIEFEVHEALHRLRACTEEAPLVSVRPQGVLVKGLTDTQERKLELLNALAPISTRGPLSLDIRTVEEAVEQAQRSESPAPVAAASPVRAPAGGKLPAETWLEKAGLDRDSILNLADRALSDSRSLLQEAWALKRLAERYGENELPPAYQARLEAMLRDHLNAMGAHGAALHQVLRQVGAARTAEAPAARTGENWAAAAADVLAGARTTDALVLASFSRQTGSANAHPEPATLADALAALEVSLGDVRAALDRPEGHRLSKAR